MSCLRRASNWLLEMETSRSHLAIAVEHGRFVLRCAVAASLAYLFASWVGLLHAVWAPISALIVSQESLSATQSSVLGRFVGTLIGVLVALLVHRLGELAEISLTPQIAIAVAICAICAKERPSIRVCLWTVPLVLVTPTPSASAEVTAFFRGCEVVIGATIGSLIHLFEERLLVPFVRRLWRRYARRRGQALAVPAKRRRCAELPDLCWVLAKRIRRREHDHQKRRNTYTADKDHSR